MSSLVFNWPLSSVTGYGIYGLQILLQYLRRGGHDFSLTDKPIEPILMPRTVDQQLGPQISTASLAAHLLEATPDLTMAFKAPVLHGIGSQFGVFKHQHRVTGTTNVACAALEEAHATDEWRAYLRRYSMFIAISRWNAAFLTSLDVGPVHLCHQGIDTALFQPHHTARSDGRFIIYSGGKFEFRKGQDIVVAAFKRFHAIHPEAQLMVMWNNMGEPDVTPFLSSGHITSVPQAGQNGEGLQVTKWLLSLGLPEGSFIALPWLGSADVARVLSFADVAIFPNRCEGGTNLVAMEAIACGVPTFVSANSGHRDLIDLVGCEALETQGPVAPCPPYRSMEQWGETQVDEIVAALEKTFDDPEGARQRALHAADIIKSWDWAPQNERLLCKVFGEDCGAAAL